VAHYSQDRKLSLSGMHMIISPTVFELQMGGAGAISTMRSRHVETVHHRRSSRHHRPTVGSRVCLTRLWRRRGPLQPGQEGVLLSDAHNYHLYYVRASNVRRWCYFQSEITPCHGVGRQIVWQYETVHHRRLSRHHRPTVGSRVCLTSFWRRRAHHSQDRKASLPGMHMITSPTMFELQMGGDGAIYNMRSRHVMGSRDKLRGNTRLCITDVQAVINAQQLARVYV